MRKSLQGKFTFLGQKPKIFPLRAKNEKIPIFPFVGKCYYYRVLIFLILKTLKGPTTHPPTVMPVPKKIKSQILIKNSLSVSLVLIWRFTHKPHSKSTNETAKQKEKQKLKTAQKKWLRVGSPTWQFASKTTNANGVLSLSIHSRR